jgi:hypothetical protein
VSRELRRYDAQAVIVPDEEQGIVGGRVGLLRLVLTDDGPLTDPDTGREYTQPDVFCHLTARQAPPARRPTHDRHDHVSADTL